MLTLIIGANSDIAYALAKKLAQQKNSQLVLASRDLDRLNRIADDIRVRFNVSVHASYLDVTKFDTHKQFIENLPATPNCVVYAAGNLGGQSKQACNTTETLSIINTNYVGAVLLIEQLASRMKKQGNGVIVGISSVAGERGRASNYIYGSSKAAFTCYLSGLRARLNKSGLRVVTVLPGFVKTKMVEHLQLPRSLTATPEQVADRVVKAMKKNKPIIYVRPIWRIIMFVIRAIPESVFVKLKL